MRHYPSSLRALLNVAVSASAIALLAPSGLLAQSITEFPLPVGRTPTGIAAGPDGSVWFTDDTDRVGRISPTGDLVEFVIPGASSGAWSIALGPDGAFWFTESNGNQIGRITASGVITNEFVPPTTN